MKKVDWIPTLLLSLILGTLCIPIIINVAPGIVGADSSYTIMSGSMRPTLNPGDIVIVKEQYPIDLNDILTVKSEDFTYTHRVVEKLSGEPSSFRLKGDANEDPDSDLVKASEIIGKVIFVFPFSILYTPPGFALAVLAPAALILVTQFRTIHNLIKRKTKRETIIWRRKRNHAFDTNILLLVLILMLSTTRVLAPRLIDGSLSYFSDTENAAGFSISAGQWYPSFNVEGSGFIQTVTNDPLNIKEGALTSDGTIIQLEVDSNIKSWTITNYELKTGLDEDILPVLTQFDQTLWYDSIIKDIGDPSTWTVEIFKGVQNGENLDVKIINYKYIISSSYENTIIKSFFISDIGG